jgi:hypothetical protein
MTLKAKFFTLFLTIFLHLFVITYAIADEWLTYSTKGHIKSNGLNITIRYPSKFEHRDEDYPNVIQTFIGYLQMMKLSQLP